MTNDEANARAEDIASRVRVAAAAGENPDDLYRLVFVNTKVLIVELIPVEPVPAQGPT